MKLSLALGQRGPLSRQTAWGCFTSNLVLPGSGSLAAGRLSGYVQLALAAGGTVLTLVFGARFLLWYLANWSHLNDDQDPVGALLALWLAIRWTLLGIAVFALGWLWGLATGWHLVQLARKTLPPQPPRLS